VKETRLFLVEFNIRFYYLAVQIQQSWAYKNNVNLLTSGANQPEVGSTGTGIFAGRYGPLVSFMTPLLQR
jgi:pantetheine hydrolase